MKLGIMQPYFFPYIGYFQLIAAVDKFVIYDNIKYTKKGWINRNRMLRNGTDITFTLSLKKDADYLDVIQRELAPSFDREKLLNQLAGAYQKAPYFKLTFPMLQKIIRNEDNNLFRYILNSVIQISSHLGIQTEFVVSSKVDIDHNLKAQDKVLALCEALGASTYINPIGGAELYDQTDFADRGIDLKFIESLKFKYSQFDNTFVPWLSIIDVLMFNPLDLICDQILPSYEMT